MTALGDRTHWYILNIDFNFYHALNPFFKKTTLTTNKRYAISISQSGIHLFSWNESRIIDQVALSIIRSSIHIPKWNVFRNFTLLSFLYLLSKKYCNNIFNFDIARKLKACSIFQGIIRTTCYKIIKSKNRFGPSKKKGLLTVNHKRR